MTGRTSALVALDIAIAEADRFIERAREARAALEEYKTVGIFPSAKTAAAKRASMDLTRALVHVRR